MSYTWQEQYSQNHLGASFHSVDHFLCWCVCSWHVVTYYRATASPEPLFSDIRTGAPYNCPTLQLYGAQAFAGVWAHTLIYVLSRNATLSRSGFEPPTFAFVGERAIHWTPPTGQGTGWFLGIYSLQWCIWVKYFILLQLQRFNASTHHFEYTACVGCAWGG